jgi:hypothetical protein
MFASERRGEKGEVVMKKPWFREWGWVYYPVTWQGIVLVVLILAFCIQVFLAVDSRSHSVSDTLYGVFPYIIPSLLVLNWVASKTSQSAR